MASRTWFNIPSNHQFKLQLHIVSGTDQIVANAIYDPVGPALDPPWMLNQLLNGVERSINDGNAAATFDARYVKPELTVIEVVASVNDINTGAAFLDTDGESEFRQQFQGNGPGGRTELPFYLFMAERIAI